MSSLSIHSGDSHYYEDPIQFGAPLLPTRSSQNFLTDEKIKDILKEWDQFPQFGKKDLAEVCWALKRKDMIILPSKGGLFFKEGRSKFESVCRSHQQPVPSLEDACMQERHQAMLIQDLKNDIWLCFVQRLLRGGSSHQMAICLGTKKGMAGDRSLDILSDGETLQMFEAEIRKDKDLGVYLRTNVNQSIGEAFPIAQLGKKVAAWSRSFFSMGGVDRRRAPENCYTGPGEQVGLSSKGGCSETSVTRPLPAPSFTAPSAPPPSPPLPPPPPYYLSPPSPIPLSPQESVRIWWSSNGRDFCNEILNPRLALLKDCWMSEEKKLSRAAHDKGDFDSLDACIKARASCKKYEKIFERMLPDLRGTIRNYFVSLGAYPPELVEGMSEIFFANIRRIYQLPENLKSLGQVAHPPPSTIDHYRIMACADESFCKDVLDEVFSECVQTNNYLVYQYDNGQMHNLQAIQQARHEIDVKLEVFRERCVAWFLQDLRFQGLEKEKIRQIAEQVAQQIYGDLNVVYGIFPTP